jgi:hypothetical protein
MLAVFFVTAIQAEPAQAGTPGWKEAVADIAEIRDATIDDLLDLVADFQDFLAGEPSAAEAAAELAITTAEMVETAAEGGEDIRSIMNEYPRSSQVQDAGVFAVGMVGLARNYAIDRATIDYTTYVDGLPPTTTTTTFPVTTTTFPCNDDHLSRNDDHLSRNDDHRTANDDHHSSWDDHHDRSNRHDDHHDQSNSHLHDAAADHNHHHEASVDDDDHHRRRHR